MIKQIIPADGWYARFKTATKDFNSTAKLVCWALFEDEDGRTKIFGMIDDEGIQNAAADDDFVGYAHLTPREEEENHAP